MVQLVKTYIKNLQDCKNLSSMHTFIIINFLLASTFLTLPNKTILLNYPSLYCSRGCHCYRKESELLCEMRFCPNLSLSRSKTTESPLNFNSESLKTSFSINWIQTELQWILFLWHALGWWSRFGFALNFWILNFFFSRKTFFLIRHLRHRAVMRQNWKETEERIQIQWFNS